MRTPASMFKHPIHPMLIVFPIGLWIFWRTVICLAGASLEVLGSVALFTMVGGFIGALSAAVNQDLSIISFIKGGELPVKILAQAHMVINLTAVVLYAINIWLRIRLIPKEYQHLFSFCFRLSRGAFLCFRVAWRPFCF